MIIVAFILCDAAIQGERRSRAVLGPVRCKVSVDQSKSTHQRTFHAQVSFHLSTASFLMRTAHESHNSPPDLAAAIEDETAGVNPQTVERLVAATRRATVRKFMVGL